MKNIFLISLTIFPILIFKINNSTAQNITESKIGYTKFDQQSLSSIPNSIVVNSDGTIATAWTYSPDADNGHIPPFPFRGSGYNYFDGVNWTRSWNTAAREETIRTGYTNIVNTANGSELLISHSAVVSTYYSRIAVTRRPVKGIGSWTTSYPFGNTSYDTWAKATSAGDNVYTIFQGSGVPPTITSPPNIVAGQNGPIYFSRSLDGGVTWDPKSIISLIDSSHYLGFMGDSYSIDARDSIVAISYGDRNTDIGLLKSTDYGATWSKTIVQQHPIPYYNTDSLTDTNHDGLIDTILSNGGDSHVLIDLNGMCHVWFSDLRYTDSDTSDNVNTVIWNTDGLEYWNETMATNAYVKIAGAQDLNGNGQLDIPVTGGTIDSTCARIVHWGDYNSGITIMPSAGIDAYGKIYLSYSTVDETADTTLYGELFRHVYMKALAPPYIPTNWTNPVDIVPLLNVGGSRFYEEAVYAFTAKNVRNNFAYVLYQRDAVPGISQSVILNCDYIYNKNTIKDIIVARVNVFALSTLEEFDNNLFVEQNYPNPASAVTRININLKQSSDVKFLITDVIGKLIYAENNNQMQAGKHSLSINTSGFEPGIYYYTVSDALRKITKCMIVQ